jgi:uncharacterized protein (TIGR02996 family)
MTATADELALLAAVFAAPADDMPRVAYADWLEEHGMGHRAALISHQLELFRAGKTPPQQNLVWPPNHAVTLTWSRGFVTSVRGSLAAFWGAPCPACNGTGNVSGRHPPARHDSQCFHRVNGVACNNGRVPGPAPAFRELCRREPVERVEVTDWVSGQLVHQLTHPTNGRFVGKFGLWPDDVPAEVFAAAWELYMENRVGTGGRPDDRRLVFDAKAEAVAAFSQALITLARKE